MNTNKATKDEMKALYTAFDIHRRAVTLAAMWTAWDTFGAVVYELRVLEEAAWNLRERVQTMKPFWDFTKGSCRMLMPIKEGPNKYGTFRSHIKGIEGALRRLLRNPWLDKELHQSEHLTAYICDIRECLTELRRQM